MLCLCCKEIEQSNTIYMLTSIKKTEQNPISQNNFEYKTLKARIRNAPVKGSAGELYIHTSRICCIKVLYI